MKYKKGFTIIEVLAVIVVLVIIFLISQALIGNVIAWTHKEACLANGRSMEKAAHNYLTLEEGQTLPEVGSEMEVALVRLMNEGYVTPVFDPATKQLVDLYESKVLVKNELDGPKFSNIIVSPTCNGALETPEVPGEVGEEMVWDGWMRLTLYYPESSTERKWRLSEEGEIRSDPLLLWQNYEGPILVPLSRTADVWISYKIGEETVIVPPAGRFLVDIQANPVGGNNVEKVTVTIIYDKDASVKEYRVGNSGWLPYVGAFEVSENTVIEARGSKDDEVYDNQGNYIMTRKIAGRDLLYINYIGLTEEVNLAAPTITRNPGVEEGEVAKVAISYPEGAVRSVYKLNYGIEEEYTGEVPVTRYGTHVIAYYYDASGKRSLSSSMIIGETSTPSVPYEPAGPNTPVVSNPNKPASSVPAPSIGVSPQTITTSVEVSVSTPATADKIYIKVGRYGSYERYTNPITVHKNTEIYAYYINYEGFRSDVGYAVVNNIKEDAKPYLKIEANPYPYNGRYGDASVEVSITSADANLTEYSLDGIYYQPYTTAFTVTENKRIYARAVNSAGETTRTLDITNIGKLQTPPSIKVLDIGINVVPESIGNQRYESVKVTIDYDNDATNRYYRLGNSGILQAYTGEFSVSSNTTVYAYASGVNAKGEARRKIDFLLTGISEPNIRVYPSGEASNVTVSIDFDKYASVKRYRINNGTWTDYTGDIIINQNETKIDAYNQNSLGHRAESSYTIQSIIPSPPSVLIDKGNYFILKLSYPPTSNNREYKFKETGEWRGYQEVGILLIKSKYQNQVIQNGSLIQIENEHGQMVNFTGDYYLIDVPINEILENVYMRWDKETPAAPTILLSTTSPTKEVDVTISYPNSAVRKEYRVVKPNGESTGWLTYENTFKVTEKNTTIYARGMNSTEVWSTESIKKITNIDEQPPVITLTADLETPSRNLGVRITATDDTGVSIVKWAPDNRDETYFRNNGTVIPNNSVFVVLMNGTYSVYVEDQVGNYTIETITITNIDNEAPDIEINANPAYEVGTSVEISIDFGDSVTKQYKIGTSNQTWSNYITSVPLTSYQVIQNGWKNADNTVSVYARGVDAATNETIVTKKLLNLDVDIPSTPVITSNYGYPVLTSYGVKFDGSTTIGFDQREGILNEYSIDNGNTWLVYAGEFQASSGIVRARSTKQSTGLRIEASKTNTVPADALPAVGYDGNDDTYIGVPQYIIAVDSSVWGTQVRLLSSTNHGSNPPNVQYLNAQNAEISTFINWNEGVLTIPSGTAKIKFFGGTLHEIGVSNEPKFSRKTVYPTLHLDSNLNLKITHEVFTIQYTTTSVEKLYRIGTTGPWIAYTTPVKVNQGQTIQAKGVDQFGRDTRIISQHTVNVADALPAVGYDGNDATSIGAWGTQYFIGVDQSVIGKAVRFVNSSDHGSNPPVIAFLNGQKTEISNIINWGTMAMNIPAGTQFIRFSGGTIHEVGLSTGPIGTVTNFYPLLHLDPDKMIRNSYSVVSLQYYDNAFQKLYRIGTTGPWLPYTEAINVTAGQTLYSKSIDINGQESRINYFAITANANAIKPEILDGDPLTYATGVNITYRMMVDPSMHGKTIYIKQGVYTEVMFWDSNWNQLTHYPQVRESRKFHVPVGARWFGIYHSEPVYEVMIDPFYIPPMTSATAPSPFSVTASSNHPGHDPYLALDGTLSTPGWASSATDLNDGNVWLRVKLDKAITAHSYYITSRNDGSTEQTPTSWKLQGGNDGTSWTDIDVRNNITDFLIGEQKGYKIQNPGNYLYYRLVVLNNAGGGGHVAIDEFNIVNVEDYKDPMDSSFENYIPIMTSDTSPTPFVVTASSVYPSTNWHEPYKAFDGTLASGGWASGGTDLTDGNAWLQIKLDKAISISSYFITARNDHWTSQTPTSWKLQGSNNGTSWTDVDTRNEQLNWYLGEQRNYQVKNQNSYLYYRLYITQNMSNGRNLMTTVDEFNIMERK